MYDMNGNRVLHNPLEALKGKKTYTALDLKEPWRSDRRMTTSWHIEGGVAAYMRRNKVKEMTLWLNIPPCGGLGNPDPMRCWGNLEKILPKGYVLHIRWEKEDGSYDYQKFDGTGEALI
jgi:hypothetical protein